MAKKQLAKHSCTHNGYQYSNYSRSLLEASSSKNILLPNKDISLIWDFYVHHAPIKKEKNQKGPAVRHLSEYGWEGTAGDYALRKLEKSLCEMADLPKIVMLKSSGINDTLKSMNLLETGCIECPRAVLKHNTKIQIDEYGKVNIKDDDGNRMICLFRHIRNSLAHGNIYFFKNGNMMLEDFEDKSAPLKYLFP